jgi:4-amino-4-deoxy-L-arabinose transferase-like glycosyltransferase
VLPAGFAAFQQCLAEQGVQLTGGPPNQSDPKMQAAFAACQSVAPAGLGAGAPGAAGGPAGGAAGGPAAGAPAGGAAGGPAAGAPAGGATGGPGGIGGGAFGGAAGWKRFFGASIADQVLWLVPFGLMGLALAGVLALRRRRLDAKVGSLVLWGGWFVISFVVFSLAKGIFHPYYVSLVAPGAAALAGIGFASVAEAGTGRRWRAAIGAVGLALTAWLEIWLVTSAHYATGLRLVIGAVVALAALLLVLGEVVGVERLARLRAPILGAAVATLLVGPALWSAQALRHAESATFPSAGPRDGASGPGGALLGGAPGQAAGATSGLAAYLKANRHGERWVLAVSSSMQASSYIIDDDLPVMAMGGFSGSDKAMTSAKLADLVTKGELRFVSAAGGGIGGPGGPGGASTATAKVASVCTVVPASAYGGTDASAAAGGGGGFGGPGGFGGAGTIYDCQGHGAELA